MDNRQNKKWQPKDQSKKDSKKNIKLIQELIRPPKHIAYNYQPTYRKNNQNMQSTNKARKISNELKKL